MNKTALGVFAALVLLGIVILALSAGEEITNKDSNGTTIVAFGDSLVKGIGATSGNNFVDILEEKSGKEIINMGVSGNTTADGLRRIEDVANENPKVVIILLGGNDALRKVPADETFENLREIIRNIHNSGSAVILVGIQSGILGDQYKARFKDLAKEENVGFVPDILDGLFGKSEYMSDPIHPNNAGYAIIADRILPVLLDITD